MERKSRWIRMPGIRADAPSVNKSPERSKALRERNDSFYAKLQEKQKNTFKIFRATNAFLRQPNIPKPLYHRDSSSLGMFDNTASVVSDSLPQETQDQQYKSEIEKIQTFVNYVNQKFSSVEQNKLPEASFVTNDDYYVDSVLDVADVSGTIFDYVSLDEQFLFRTTLYQTLIDNVEIFSTIKKMLELHILRGWIDPDPNPEEDDTSVVKCVCSGLVAFLVNGTDCHPAFGEVLCKKPGLLEILVLFLREKKTATLENMENDKVTWLTITYSVMILYNCSMNDANSHRLQETNALEASLPFIDSDDHSMSLVALLTVAYLADEKQSEIFKAKKGPIVNLIMRMKEAIESEEKRDSNAWSATELIKGLGRLALNDANKCLIAECGAIPVLVQQVRQDESPMEQLASAEVIWTLSFDKKLLKSADVFNEAKEVLKRLAQTPNHTCQEAARGVLWNLRSASEQGSMVTTTTDGSSEPGDKKQSPEPYVMISYQWDSQALILKLRDELKSCGYNVWIDVEKMQGSILEAMAEAVENAEVVLLCCSKKYKDSQNCRAEAEYTYKRKKEYIPLIVEPRYYPDGWLGIMIGVRIYYNFTRSFDEKFQELVRALGQKGKNRQDTEGVTKWTPEITRPANATKTYSSAPPKPKNSTLESSHGPVTTNTQSESSKENPGPSSLISRTTIPTSLQNGRDELEGGVSLLKQSGKDRQEQSDIELWDPVRVNKWKESHNIDKEKLGYLTGSHLHFLQRMKMDAPSVYYTFIQEKLDLTDISQMAALSNALEKF